MSPERTGGETASACLRACNMSDGESYVRSVVMERVCDARAAFGLVKAPELLESLHVSGRPVNSHLVRKRNSFMTGCSSGVLRRRIWSKPTKRASIERDGGLCKMLNNA